MADPLSTVYDALWTLMEGNTTLASLVKPGNRIKFNQQRPESPVKDQVSEADLPELMLVVSSIEPNMQATSNSSSLEVTFDWVLSTGDMSVLRKLLPVTWYLYCAMTNWNTILTALTWNGREFVKRCEALTANTGLADPERNRGIVGWSCLWSCKVLMYFTTTDLRGASGGVTTTTTTTPTTT